MCATDIERHIENVGKVWEMTLLLNISILKDNLILNGIINIER